MKVTISFQNIEHTPALDERIQEKSKKLLKWMDGKTHIKWNCFVKDNHHYAEVDCVGSKFEFHATARSDSLYKSIDMAIEKLEKQLSKKSTKLKNKIHRNRGQKLVILDPEAAWMDYYDEDYDEAA